MEVRHDTWLQETSLTLMTKYDIGLVISQSGELFPYSEMITAKNIYIRFHGIKRWYRHDYSDSELREWAAKIRACGAKHVWAYFNNDRDCYAIKNARTLMRLLKG